MDTRSPLPAMAGGAPAAPEGEALADERRRRFLTGAVGVVGAVGVLGAAGTFTAALAPSERARALGAPVDVDISKLEPGQQLTVKWRGKPVWVLRRTEQMLNDLPRLNPRLRDPDSLVTSQQPPYARNPYRAIRSEYLVVIGLCTHLGCVPNFRPEYAPPDLGPEWLGGYFCPCHGSRFDLAGRVFQGVPAPTNLVVPPHTYVNDTVVRVGIDLQ